MKKNRNKKKRDKMMCAKKQIEKIKRTEQRKNIDRE